MAKSTEHNLTLTATDRASRPVYQMYQKLKREGKALTNNERQRKMLGIRGEREIQAEILRTQRAYQQLARSGKLSSEQLARAKNAELKKIRELNAEMGKSEKLSTSQKGKAIFGAAAGAYVGAKAASRIIMDPVTKVYDFDRSMKGITKTAYAGENAEGLRKGEQHLRNIVDRAMIDYKATQTQALEALDGAFTAGFDVISIEDVLPFILKTTQSGANPADLGKLAKSFLDNGYKIEDIEKSFNQMVMSGAMGSYEVADMAAAMPKILSASRAAGSTRENLPQTLAALQVITKTSGNSNVAETQYLRMLSEMNGENFNNRMKEMTFIDDKGKRQNVNWEQTRTEAAKNGKSPEEAIISTIGKILDADPKLKKYKQNLNSNDIGIREDAAIKVMESGLLSKIFSNDMSRNAVVGLLQQKEMYHDQVEGVVNAPSIVDYNYEYEVGSAEKKHENLKETIDRHTGNAFKPIAELIGKKSGDLANWMDKNPELSEKGMLATTIISAGAALAGSIYAGSKINGLFTATATGAGEAGTGAASTMAAAGSPLARMFLSFMRGATVLGVADLAGSGYNDPNMAESVKKSNQAALPYLDEFLGKHGEEGARAAYKMFGPMGWHTDNSWKNGDASILKNYFERYDKVKQIENEYGADAAQSAYDSYRPYLSFGGDWRKENPDKILQYIQRSLDGQAFRNSYGQSESDIGIPNFSDVVISISKAIDALNPLADLPRQLELLQNAKPQEIIVNMPVSLDGRVIYENQERILVNQLNRGV